MKPLQLFIVAIVLAGASAAWYTLGSGHGSEDKDKTKDALNVPLVSVIVPVVGAVPATVSLTGAISARNDMPIGVEGDGGRIIAVLVEPGDRVHRGQVLARLNPLTAQSQVQSAEAALEDARAAAATAESEFARAQGARSAFSAEEFDRRRTSSLSAKAKERVAEAQLAESRSRWAHATVVAPSDGIVLTRAAEVGQVAVPGSSILFRLGRDSQVEMRGQVAEQDMPRLKVGQEVEVRLDGVAQVYPGKVWQVGAVIDPSTRQGMVRVTLSTADQNLRPGAFARAEIHVGAAVGAVLPQTAVLSDPQGSYVLLVNADNRTERRAVTVAGTNPRGLLISSGLKGNERVVDIAAAFLRPGEVVKVAPNPVTGSAAAVPASVGRSAP